MDENTISELISKVNEAVEKVVRDFLSPQQQPDPLAGQKWELYGEECVIAYYDMNLYAVSIKTGSTFRCDGQSFIQFAKYIGD